MLFSTYIFICKLTSCWFTGIVYLKAQIWSYSRWLSFQIKYAPHPNGRDACRRPNANVAEGGPPLPVLRPPPTRHLSRPRLPRSCTGIGSHVRWPCASPRCVPGSRPTMYCCKTSTSCTGRGQAAPDPVCLFWDMRKAQYTWLNGPYGPHTCTAEGLDGPLVSGFGTQPRSFRMLLKLQYLRRTAHVF